MVLALVRVLGELIYDFLTALGTSLPNLGLQAVWLVALGASLPFAVGRGGIEGVAIAHAVVAIVVVLPAFCFVLQRAGVSMRAMLGQFFRPLTAAGAAAAAGLGGVLLVPDHRFAQVALGCALVSLVYLAIVYPMRALLKAPMLGSA